MLRRRRIFTVFVTFVLLSAAILSYLALSNKDGRLQAIPRPRWRQSDTLSSQPPQDGATLNTESVNNGNDEVDISNIEPIPVEDQLSIHLDWDRGELEPDYPQNMSVNQSTYHELRALSTLDQKYFNLTFGRQESLNPGIIPHPDPSKTDTWVMAAELQRSKVLNSVWFAQLVCDARFKNGSLDCIHEPTILPLASTRTKHCEEQFAFFALNVGPHDGRIFYGPDAPYVMYGSNSGYGCFGVWMQDLRMLADWGHALFEQDNYRFATELQRPDTRGQIEKNWLVFWDTDDHMHVQHQTTPYRHHAELHSDGSTGPDLGYKTKDHDVQCMRTYLPQSSSPLDSIYQSSNTLSITLCTRDQASCHDGAEKTFLMTIVEHKSFHGDHFVHESYLYLFQRDKPFKIHGIGDKPLWIHGREMRHQPAAKGNSTDDVIESDPYPERLQVTGMSWKGHGQTYNGFLDDVLFLSFGIERERSGAIDVRAGDLISHVKLCFGRFNRHPMALAFGDPDDTSPK